VTAIVRKAEPGEELTCKFPEKIFGKTKYGIISYYATKTMSRATTVVSWLGLINDLIDKDFSRGILTPLEKPSLQILGNPASKLPGAPIGVQLESTPNDAQNLLTFS
jgi:hypothetical protein